MIPPSAPIREQRTELSGSLTLQYGLDDSGAGHWRNVSRTGAQLRMGRYLRPGRTLHMQFDSPVNPGTHVALEARVIWCKINDSAQHFDAGVTLYRQDPEATLAFSTLGYAARQEANNSSEREVQPTVWLHFPTEFNAQPQEVVGAIS